MRAVEKLKRCLRSGQVYRRADLVSLSNSVDRHLRQLVESGQLRKIRTGIYYSPKMCVFGEVPALDKKVIAAFLKTDDFFVMSLNEYNGMGLGTTQLYNERLVYNHKRNGHFVLNSQKFYFLKSRKFPKNPTDAFLLVDLINNIEMLSGDGSLLKERVARQARLQGKDEMVRVAKAYGKISTRKYFDRVFQNGDSRDVD